MRPALRSLYICYLSLEDPLVRTQVVAYLAGLAQQGHTIHLLTFEGELPRERRRELREELGGRGIAWHALRYHKRPSLPATVFDTLVGAAVAARLVRRHRLDAIHARNHVPAAMALIVRRLTGCRFIFDLRGLMAEEYVDAGIWERGGLPYRLTTWVQDVGLRRADGTVVLTEAVRRHLNGATRAREPAVIPCCVDLGRVDGHGGDRAAARQALGIGERPVMLYVGKFTGWYMDREMVEFFAAARRQWPELLFLVLTQADTAPIEAELRRAGVPPSDVVITSARPDEIGAYLAAADFAVSFVRPCLSKISSSPTKVAEYLAAGLPVVSTSIGDLADLFGDGRLGVLVDDFSSRGYDGAARAVRLLAADPETGRRCRDVAEAELSLERVGIPRYDALYRQVAGR